MRINEPLTASRGGGAAPARHRRGGTAAPLTRHGLRRRRRTRARAARTATGAGAAPGAGWARRAAARRGAGGPGAALGRGLAGLEHDRLERREGDGGAQGAVQERWASGVCDVRSEHVFGNRRIADRTARRRTGVRTSGIPSVHGDLAAGDSCIRARAPVGSRRVIHLRIISAVRPGRRGAGPAGRAARARRASSPTAGPRWTRRATSSPATWPRRTPATSSRTCAPCGSMSAGASIGSGSTASGPTRGRTRRSGVTPGSVLLARRRAVGERRGEDRRSGVPELGPDRALLARGRDRGRRHPRSTRHPIVVGAMAVSPDSRPIAAFLGLGRPPVLGLRGWAGSWRWSPGSRRRSSSRSCP